MKVFLLALLLVCHVCGRPSDPPVTREFGVQPNNPNVKIFSTYPTSKPVIRQDNPNDLEKADHEKFEKDENETNELKGDDIFKAGTEDSEKAVNGTEMKMSDEDVVNDAVVSSMSTTSSEIEGHDNTNTKNETDAILKNESSQSDAVDSLSEISADDMTGDLTMVDEVLPVAEVEGDGDMVIEDMVTGDMVIADPNPTIIDEPIVPMSEPEVFSPIAIDDPSYFLPPISEYDIDEDYVFNVPELEVEEPNYTLGDQNSGVFLDVPPLDDYPTLVEDYPTAYRENEKLNPVAETTTLLPIAVEQSIDNAESIPVDSSSDQVEAVKSEVEITKDTLEPMASLTDESVILDPAVETDGSSVFSEQENMNLDEVTTQINMDMEPMNGGDLGASLPMNENISPIMEAELELAQNTHPENVAEEQNAKEIPEITNEKISLKITKLDQEYLEGTDAEASTATETEKPNQMAGFMSEEQKDSPAPSTDEMAMSTTTELVFLLNFTDSKNESHQDTDATHSESTAVIDTASTEQAEPMDNLENIENFESSTVKVGHSTTEGVPTIHPIELTFDETNNDLTLNEAI